MEKNVLLVLVGKRRDTAQGIQKILTEFGCMIKTRLGLHDGVLNVCSDSGLIFLEVVGEKSDMEEMTGRLNRLDDVKAKLVTLSLD